MKLISDIRTIARFESCTMRNNKTVFAFTSSVIGGSKLTRIVIRTTPLNVNWTMGKTFRHFAGPFLTLSSFIDLREKCCKPISSKMIRQPLRSSSIMIWLASQRTWHCAEKLCWKAFKQIRIRWWMSCELINISMNWGIFDNGKIPSRDTKDEGEDSRAFP